MKVDVFEKDAMLLKKLLIVLCFLPSLAFADITVGTGKQYESFTPAVYETCHSGEDIVVDPGEYDIKQEYQTYFGIDRPHDEDDLGNMFQ